MFFITFNNPTDADTPEKMGKRLIEKYKGIEYIIVGEERGDKTNRRHFHAFIKFSRLSGGVRWSSLNKYFFNSEGHYDEIVKGSRYDSIINYISKPAAITWEWGDRPVGFIKIGGRADLDYAYELLESGETIDDIINLFPHLARNKNALLSQQEAIDYKKYGKKIRKQTNIYIQGPTGTGKTRSIKLKHDFDICSVEYDQSFPYNAYTGQKALLYDEFNSSRKIEEMLKKLNPEPEKIDIKNGSVWAKYNNVYVVSNINIEDQYKNVKKEKPIQWMAFIRRFKYLYIYTSFLTYDIYEIRGIADEDGKDRGIFDFKYIKTIQEKANDPEARTETIDETKRGKFYASGNIKHYEEEADPRGNGIKYILTNDYYIKTLYNMSEESNTPALDDEEDLFSLY